MSYIPAPARKRRHVFRWVFLAIQAVFLIWLITGATAASHTPCTGNLSTTTCHQAVAAGTGLGVLVVIFVWLAVDVILGVGYLIFRRR